MQNHVDTEVASLHPVNVSSSCYSHRELMNLNTIHYKDIFQPYITRCQNIGINKVGDVVILKDITPVCVEWNLWLLICYQWHSASNLTQNKTVFSQAYDLNLIIKTQPHCQGSAHKIHIVSIMGTTVVNCPARKTRGEQYSQLYCLKTRDIHRPTLMRLLSSEAVMQRL